MVTLNRLSTKTGDTGTTGLADGTRVPKDHPLIQAIGSVDEANCVLGLVRLETLPSALIALLPQIQNDLFDLGGDLAMPPGGPYEDKIPRISETQVARLDAAVADATAQVEPLKSFILPAGSRAASLLHLARTVVRRAERDLVAAMAADQQRPWNPCALKYLNRLSDCCFAWSRLANDGGRADVLWVPGKGR